MRKDLSGMKFGRVTVLQFDHMDKRWQSVWQCMCDCGTPMIVRGASLISGNTQSCGCYQKERASDANVEDISGKRFGRLTVLYRMGSNDYWNSQWVCRCDCGKKAVVVASKLKNGHTQSCGCLHIESITTHGMSNTKEYFRAKSNKRREASRKLDTEWNVNLEIALSRMFPVCVACGGMDRLSTDHVYPLDMGYGLRPGNAVRLCVHCNSTKHTKTPQELPDNMRDKILTAAEEFRIYCDKNDMKVAL
jgi:5-methylcytosine-specific restriction endonuclease McrA